MPPIPPEQSPFGGGAPYFDQLAYSIEETARITSVGRTGLYAEIKAGRLKARKAGRRTVLLADDIRQWLVSLPQINGGANDLRSAGLRRSAVARKWIGPPSPRQR
jgi:hypothetical protein